MKLFLINFVSFIAIFCLIASSHGFQEELCKPGFAGYIDIRDVRAWKDSGSKAIWIGNGLDTLEWSAENNDEDMILEIELKAAKNISEIHTGKRTTISLVKIMYSLDGKEWHHRFSLDEKKNEKEMVIFDCPVLIKYLKLMAIAVGDDGDEPFMDFKIVACNECNDSLVSELDVDRIRISRNVEEAGATIGNIRLSEERPLFEFRVYDIPPVIAIDLGKVYKITGMIIKGEEGKGTGALDYFSITYDNRSEYSSSLVYRTEKGRFGKFEGTTKEEYIRYEPLIPFVARYFFIGGIRSTYHDVIAMQIDVFGCNIRGPLCNDIINTTPGEIIKFQNEEDRCRNHQELEIKFVENGIYQITSVNIIVTGNNGFTRPAWRSTVFMITYNYDSKNKRVNHDYQKHGRRGIFRQTVTLVQSLKLCVFSSKFKDEGNDMFDVSNNIIIYNNITIKVRGCRIGNPPSSSIE